MCQVLRLSDRDIETIGEAKAFFPKGLVGANFYKSPSDDKFCLCSVDLPATGALNGMRIVPDGFGDYRLAEDGPQPPGLPESPIHNFEET